MVEISAVLNCCAKELKHSKVDNKKKTK